MFYTLLGRLVWFAAKWFVRRKYGSAAPKVGIAAGVLAVALAAVLLARRNGGD
jgi:hypothetical protein